MPVLALYGSKIYGTSYYGKATSHPGANAVDDFYVIREPDKYILKWIAPITNIDSSPATMSSYVVIRTLHTNKSEAIQIANITTLDVSGHVDTCYVDTDIDTTKNYLYQIVPINQYGLPGVSSPWVTDWNMVRDTKYDNSCLYVNQKFRYFNKQLETLNLLDTYDTEANVLPLKIRTKTSGTGVVTPIANYAYVDFFPNIPEGTVLKVMVDGVVVAQNYNRAFFYVTLNNLYKSQQLKLQVTDVTGQTVYRTRYYKLYDYLIFAATTAAQFTDLHTQIITTQNDLFTTECSTDKVYPNYGSFFDFPKPKYMSDEIYRRTVVGYETTVPGLVHSFLDGGTLKGLKDLIFTFTGQTPDIRYFRNSIGCIIPTDPILATTKYVVGLINGPPPHMYWNLPGYWGSTAYWGAYESPTVDDQFWGGTFYSAVGFSRPFKAFSLRVTVYGSVQSIVDEEVVSSAYIDFLDGTDVTVIDSVTDEVGNSYVQDINFTLNAAEGSLNWQDPSLPLGHLYPAAGIKYVVSYSFKLNSTIMRLASLLKQPQYNIVYAWK